MRTPLLLCGLSFIACSPAPLSGPADSGSPDSGSPDAGASPDAGTTACAPGATRCEGDLYSTCSDDGSGYSVAVACNLGVCVGTACKAPTVTQLAQADELDTVVDFIRAQTAYPYPLDYDALKADGRARIERGDGSALAYFDAAYHVFLGVPEGHQALFLTGTDKTQACGTLVPYPSWARRGACGRPHAEGIVITYAKSGNALGLSAGDLVVKLGTTAGPDVLTALADRPVCADGTPSKAFLDTQTASTFADLLHPAEVLTVKAPDGTLRTVTVPDGELSGDFTQAVRCVDLFARDAKHAVTSELIADGGVGLIRLPGFTDPEQTLPMNPTQQQYEMYLATFEAKIQAAFDAVKGAPAIVWDIRGNGGGLTQVGLDIASGFPGAQSTQISYCQFRNPNSVPTELDPTRYALYQLAPGGTFAYSGKVAVLTDGMNYSAADYFPLAAKSRTQAILVGSATAGAFGASGASKTFNGPPPYQVFIDPNRCFDAQTNLPLEGKNTVPHVAIDYAPADLAAGRDTALDRAVLELQK